MQRFFTNMAKLVPTDELYASHNQVFVGKYKDARRTLDYLFHVNYTEERQIIQDKIVDQFVNCGCSGKRPWLVYTAGPMGAGKSYTMKWLSNQGDFPLASFVIVDPDRIKSLLPEMPSYIAMNRSLAGSLTHKESGFICELLERECMLNSKNILVDGSLRNADWYMNTFARIRAEFPIYRIAILLVTASQDTVYRRAARRARITGREIPKSVLDDAISQVPRSFQELAPLADFSAVIQNDHDKLPPEFESEAKRAEFHDLMNTSEDLCSCKDPHTCGKSRWQPSRESDNASPVTGILAGSGMLHDQHPPSCNCELNVFDGASTPTDVDSKEKE
jgi:Zeta toxin